MFNSFTKMQSCILRVQAAQRQSWPMNEWQSQGTGYGKGIRNNIELCWSGQQLSSKNDATC